MQLVPLPTDGRVTAIDSASLAPGPLRVVLEPHGDGVGVVALGPETPRLVGRLAAGDGAAYSPVLRQLRTRGLTGTCRAWATGSGALVLDLAPAYDCMMANGPMPRAAERTVTTTREGHHQPVVVEPGSRPRRRRVVWTGVAAVGVLLFAAAVGNGARSEAPAAVVAASPTSSSPTSSSTTPTATSIAPAIAEPAAPARRAVPAERVPARAVPAAAPSKPAARSVAPKPVPTTVAPAAQPKPTPKPTPKPPPSGCDPNYSSCVPIAKDVDCEGGSGDGPAYVKGPVRVIGKDIYGLDKGGQPGIGCE
jgi:hypothetical protein